MLGFSIGERTISRWMKRAPRDPELRRRWLAFLRNHREAIAAMDFFSVQTITFGVLYGFFVIAHDRRRILYCNVTTHPTSSWVIQQLRGAFPFESATWLWLATNCSLTNSTASIRTDSSVGTARIEWGRPDVGAISCNVHDVHNVHRFLSREPLLPTHHTEKIGLMILCHRSLGQAVGSLPHCLGG